ncbi:MAG TPA: uracil phosphoribosyltransferase [Kiritimatiellia bacterium]|jgi:uracil phosphoribosyltransferase|nr:uracil phosphoribosyltransferase [Kiritimatiellia bacterium]MDD4118399.1 uracil phosphoribosyltransferase [Kiritimatiellia bacterium]NCC91965.1 uracil phosphoribosyltransferase [Opitutae bacterium]HPC57542.1 uracil phosphoribosyltransferase [Kiritimatiellia bacterium]
MSATVTVLKHPLIEHKLAILRNRETDNKLFRSTLEELSYLLVYEITRDLALRPVRIHTPLAPCDALQLAEQVLLVPVLRAGLGMVSGILNLIPSAKVGHVGVYRDEHSLQPVEYYFRLPPDAASMRTFLLDPMLATGGSLAHAVELLKTKGGIERITVVSILAAPEGLDALHAAHPDVEIYTAMLDEKLNEHGYILPGLGDCGDRLFGTL